MELDPIKIFFGLKARKWLILLCALLMAALGALASYKLPKVYEARSVVQVDSDQKNALTGRLENTVRVGEFLGQQAAIAQSRTVALVVIDRLIEEGFFSMVDFEDTWRKRTGGETIAGNDARLWAADQILASLTVKGDALASSLTFTFVSSDPSQSAKLSNAFSSAYMVTVLNQRQRRATRNAQKFSDETFNLARDVEAAKQELSDFRAESGIVGVNTARLEAAEVELAALTNRLGDARADVSEAQSLLREANDLTIDSLLNLPLGEGNLPGRQAQVRLGSVAIQLARLSERFGPSYPDLIELQREKRKLENNILDSIRNRFAYAKRRLRELEVATGEQKQVVLSLQERKQTFDDLEKTVDSRRDTFDLVSARSLQESLQSRIDAVDVLLLARAVPDSAPTLPPLHVLVILGLVLGTGFGVVTAFLLELITQKIRLKKTVETILNVPVLSELELDSGVSRGYF